MNAQSSEFLTISEAARLLNLSKVSVRRRIWDGSLDVVRLGDGPKAPIRIAPGDLADYLRRVNQ